MKVTDVMDVFIKVCGENYGFITIKENISGEEFMQKVRKLTNMDLEMKEDLDLRSLINNEVINFQPSLKVLSKKYLKDIGKYDIRSFVQNDNIDLISTFLDVFDVNDKYMDITALMHACLKNYKDIAEILIENGADLEIRDRYKTTALNIVCLRGSYDAAKLLIDKGADIETMDYEDRTPIMTASFYDHTGIVELLEQKKREIN